MNKFRLSGFSTTRPTVIVTKSIKVFTAFMPPSPLGSRIFPPLLCSRLSGNLLKRVCGPQNQHFDSRSFADFWGLICQSVDMRRSISLGKTASVLGLEQINELVGITYIHETIRDRLISGRTLEAFTPRECHHQLTKGAIWLCGLGRHINVRHARHEISPVRLASEVGPLRHFILAHPKSLDLFM